MKASAIIFDFDGVIADSELPANAALADAVSKLGYPTSLQDALDIYCGKSFVDVIAMIEQRIGRPVPGTFADELFAATLRRLRIDLQEIEGATDFMDSFAHIPQSIASSSRPERLAVCLETLGLTDRFVGRVYSAAMVERGKPEPDLFLLASKRMDVDPAHCLVIEDSVGGVAAGKRAGMTVIGLCAASHLAEGHAEDLAAAGADYIAMSWAEAGPIAEALA